MALKSLDLWRYNVLDQLPASKGEMDVGFAKGDASKMDMWKDATIVFCNATCFSDSVSRLTTFNKGNSLLIRCTAPTVDASALDTSRYVQ